MVKTLKRKLAVKKAVIGKKDRNWDEYIVEILGGYRRRIGLDGKSRFEILFAIRLGFPAKLPKFDSVAFNTNFSRVFEVEIANSRRALAIVPSAPEKWG